MLINAKLDVSICDISGKNILHLLCKDSFNDEQQPKILDDSTNTDDVCGKQGRENVTKSLDEIGVYRRMKLDKLLELVDRLVVHFNMDVNLKDQAEFTPLMYACEQSSLELIELLCKHGANVNVCNSEGISCLLLAILHSSPKVVDFLLRHGFDLNCANPNISFITDAAYLNDT